jgi:hypothetical protein
MTGHVSNTADSVKDDEWTVTDPAAVAERRGVAFERRTYEHENVEHCETDAAGRAIIGVTDLDGRVLIVAQFQEEHAVLPNETVDPDGDWAAVGRERIEGMVGVEVTLNDVRLVREVEHHIDGELRSRTYHVVFGAALTTPSASLDGLCDDTPWDLRWIDAVPDWLPADDPHGAQSDMQLFVEEGP